MGNGLWLITMLKGQPWIGVAIGLLLFLGLFSLKKSLAVRVTAEKQGSR